MNTDTSYKYLYRVVWLEDQLDGKGVERLIKERLTEITINDARCMLIMARNLKAFETTLDDENSIHLAILDMKILNDAKAGLKACKLISGHSFHSRTDILIMSYDASIATQLEAYEAENGAINYFIKSTDKTSLKKFESVVRNLLSKKLPESSHIEKLGFLISKPSGIVQFRGEPIPRLAKGDRAVLIPLIENEGSMTSEFLSKLLRIDPNALDAAINRLNKKLNNCGLRIISEGGRRVICHNSVHVCKD